MNGRDDYTESNGKIVIDFKNSDIKSIKTDNFSNLNSNLVNTNLNVKSNNQPKFNQGMSQKQSNKAFSDIKTTKTIMVDPKYHNLYHNNALKNEKNVRQQNNINTQSQVANNSQIANKTISYYNGVYNRGYPYRVWLKCSLNNSILNFISYGNYY